MVTAGKLCYLHSAANCPALSLIGNLDGFSWWLNFSTRHKIRKEEGVAVFFVRVTSFPWEFDRRERGLLWYALCELYLNINWPLVSWPSLPCHWRTRILPFLGCLFSIVRGSWLTLSVWLCRIVSTHLPDINLCPPYLFQVSCSLEWQEQEKED